MNKATANSDRTAAEGQTLESLSKHLETDYFIKIHLGSVSARSTNFRVIQNQLLQTASPLLTTTMDPKISPKNRLASLRCQDDEVKPCELFIYWLIHRKLPEASVTGLLLVSCWCFGEKYDIKEFQDDVMLELLNGLPSRYPSTPSQYPLTVQMIKTAFHRSSAESKLRKVIAEELVLNERHRPSCPQNGRELASAAGLDFAELFQLCDGHRSRRGYHSHLEARFCDERDYEHLWTHYMVGSEKRFRKGQYRQAYVIADMEKRTAEEEAHHRTFGRRA